MSYPRRVNTRVNCRGLGEAKMRVSLNLRCPNLWPWRLLASGCGRQVCCRYCECGSLLCLERGREWRRFLAEAILLPGVGVHQFHVRSEAQSIQIRNLETLAGRLFWFRNWKGSQQLANVAWRNALGKRFIEQTRH